MVAFNFVTLRVSWDLHRNMLGMVILIFTLPRLAKMKSWRDVAIVAGLCADGVGSRGCY